MTNYECAVAGFGVCLELIDRNGQASFFFPVDYENPAAVCGDVLVSLSVWLAENGYMPTSDGGQMVLGW